MPTNLNPQLQSLSEVKRFPNSFYLSSLSEIWVCKSLETLVEKTKEYLRAYPPAGYGTVFTLIRQVDYQLPSNIRSAHAGEFFTIMSRWMSCD